MPEGVAKYVILSVWSRWCFNATMKGFRESARHIYVAQFRE